MEARRRCPAQLAAAIGPKVAVADVICQNKNDIRFWRLLCDRLRRCRHQSEHCEKFVHRLPPRSALTWEIRATFPQHSRGRYCPLVHCQNEQGPMSALGQKADMCSANLMAALPPKATSLAMLARQVRGEPPLLPGDRVIEVPWVPLEPRFGFDGFQSEEMETANDESGSIPNASRATTRIRPKARGRRLRG